MKGIIEKVDVLFWEMMSTAQSKAEWTGRAGKDAQLWNPVQPRHGWEDGIWILIARVTIQLHPFLAGWLWPSYLN